MKTVFMGTPEFSATILDYLYKSSHTVELVITQPDRARDRGKKIQVTPVKELAAGHGTPIMQPERLGGDEKVMDRLKDIAPDIIIVAAYGQILPQEVLTLPRFGCINVHASLLPKLRGASPIQRAIADGEEKTGVTIMQMARGLDTGDIISQEEISIGRMNSGSLHDALAQAGGRLLIQTLRSIEDGTAVLVPQDESKATYAGLISKKDGKLDFSRSPEEIERLIRAYDPWPGAFCSYRGQTVKIWKAYPDDRNIDKPSGTVVGVSPEGIKISCGGKILVIEELQVPGKKRMKVSEYIKGHDVPEGTMFE